MEINVAPMYKYTNLTTLNYLRLLNSSAKLHHHMVTTYQFINSPERWRNNIDNTVFQIAGSEIKQLKFVAKIIHQLGYSELNWNLGCPSSNIISIPGGAILYKNINTIISGLSTLLDNCKLQVSLKVRIGVDNFDQFDYFVEFISNCIKVGCKIFYIHARKAFLSGINPKKNISIPSLNYDWVYKIKKHFPEAKIILNGGIKNIIDGKNKLNNLDGIMLGRAILNNPTLINNTNEKDFKYNYFLEKATKYINFNIDKKRSILLSPIMNIFNNNLEIRKLWKRKLSLLIKSRENIDLLETYKSLLS